MTTWTAGGLFTLFLIFLHNLPLPRWDLLAFVALGGGGVLIRCVALRQTPPKPAPEPVPPHAPGFRADQRAWWPARRAATGGVMLWIVWTPLFLLAIFAAKTTAMVDEIRAHGPEIARVTVTEVEDLALYKSSTAGSKSRVVQEIQANTRYDGTGDQISGKIQGTTSVEPDDELWALYAPSSPSSGAMLNTFRFEIDEYAVGLTPTHALLLITFLPAVVGVMRWRRVRAGKEGLAGQEPVAVAIHTGRARALRVRVNGHARSDLHRAPVLRLAAPEGSRELLLGKWVDTDHVASHCDGQEGWLYWARTTRDSPPLTAPGTKASPGIFARARRRMRNRRPATNAAVLVLSDGSYLRGRTLEALDGPSAPGNRIPRIRAADCPEARPAGQRVLRRPRIRPLSLAFALTGLVALSLMLSLPLGEPIGSDRGTGWSGPDVLAFFLATSLPVFAWNKAAASARPLRAETSPDRDGENSPSRR